MTKGEFDRRRLLAAGAALALAPGAVRSAGRCDIIIRGGTIYDGGGAKPYVVDVALTGERIVAMGDISDIRGACEIDAAGLAVSPGFVDTISYSWETFPYEAHAVSNIYQGVTLEIFGEGDAAFPLNAELKAEMEAMESAYKVPVTWSTYAEFMAMLEKKGVGVNFAGLAGGNTIRRYVMGGDDRAPTAAELTKMQDLVRQTMREGGLGISTGVSWPVGSFAKPDEIEALVEVVGEFNGVYAAAVRSQGDAVIEAFDEIIDICRRTRVRTDMGNIKQAGVANWGKAKACIDRIDAARAEGLPISASMYPYTGLWTNLGTALPPWAHDGGFSKLLERARDPQQKARMVAEMQAWTGGWEQLLAMSGKPENVYFLKVEKPLKAYEGKTLAEVMKLRGDPSPESVAIDMLAESGNPIFAIFHATSEDNIKTLIVQPWISFGSDSPSYVLGTVLADELVHPRAYGMVSRVIGHYARDLKLMPLEEAVRKLTSLPTSHFNVEDRGWLRPGYFADIAVFDPKTVKDVATYDNPHRYAAGMHHVFVNGVAALTDGKHTNATAGKHVRRADWTPV